MKIHEFGSRENPTLLVMSGMLQDWHTMRTHLQFLEEHYRVLYVAYDGMYPGSKDFTSFADQARQIEEFVREHYDGKLHGVYGASQGGLMVVEVLSRNNITIDTAITDGVYVAHQGSLAAWFGVQTFRWIKKHGRKIPKVMDIPMKLMGLGEEDYAMFSAMYWDASDETTKRNLYENYTYHTCPEIANTATKVHLWCGSKEPYALKSHRILKKYLKNYEEVIWDGFGHGQMLLKHSQHLCEMIHSVLG